MGGVPLEAHVELAKQHQFAVTVWDDGGSFGLYNREDGTWGEAKDILTSSQ